MKLAVWQKLFVIDKFVIYEKWPFERKEGRHLEHFLIFSSFRVVRMQKNELSIFINVDLQVVHGLHPLSAHENCTVNCKLYYIFNTA